MNRRCHITDCPKPPRPGCRYCYGHLQRRRIHGDFHFHTWKTADDQDVQTIIREARPAPGLTRLERIQVAKGLTEHQLPATEIARIVGVTPRTVYRWRSEGFRQTA